MGKGKIKIKKGRTDEERTDTTITNKNEKNEKMIARTEGIEPPPTVLETAILPLNHVRMYSNEYIFINLVLQQGSYHHELK